MIDVNDWNTSSVNFTSSYTFKDTALPTPYKVVLYDNLFVSSSGVQRPDAVTYPKIIGTPYTSLRVRNKQSIGMYLDFTINNAYDVILIDTLDVFFNNY